MEDNQCPPFLLGNIVPSQFFGAVRCGRSPDRATGRGQETGPSLPQIIEKIRNIIHTFVTQQTYRRTHRCGALIECVFIHSGLGRCIVNRAAFLKYSQQY